MKISIVGGGGRMGRWFAHYFRQRGDFVTVYDRNRAAARQTAAELDVQMTPQFSTAVRTAEVVFVSVPIRRTGSVLRAASRHMRHESLLTEISSVKKLHFALLRELARMHFGVLSIHPLFGPSTPRLKGQLLAVVPVTNKATELERARDLFPEANCVPVSRAVHDAAMAYVVLLPYLLNAAFAGTLLHGRPELVKKLASPRFARQLQLAREVVEDDPALYVEIARAAPSGPLMVQHLTDLLRRLVQADTRSVRLLRNIQRRLAGSGLAEGT